MGRSWCKSVVWHSGDLHSTQRAKVSVSSGQPPLGEVHIEVYLFLPVRVYGGPVPQYSCLSKECPVVTDTHAWGMGRSHAMSNTVPMLCWLSVSDSCMQASGILSVNDGHVQGECWGLYHVPSAVCKASTVMSGSDGQLCVMHRQYSILCAI